MRVSKLPSRRKLATFSAQRQRWAVARGKRRKINNSEAVGRDKKPVSRANHAARWRKNLTNISSRSWQRSKLRLSAPIKGESALLQPCLVLLARLYLHRVKKLRGEEISENGGRSRPRSLWILSRITARRYALPGIYYSCI